MYCDVAGHISIMYQDSMYMLCQDTGWVLFTFPAMQP